MLIYVGIEWSRQVTSATALVPVRITRVIRTALTALVESRTLLGELHSSHAILTSCTLRLACCDVYTPSQQHVRYTLHRGCSNAVAVQTTPDDGNALLRPIATCPTLPVHV